jgi:hypothetical protein
MPITGEADTTVFSDMALTMAYGGGPYTYLSVYPPFWPMILNLDVRALGLVFPLREVLRTSPQLLQMSLQFGYVVQPYLPSPQYLFVEKVPIVVFDLLTSFFLYRIILEWTASRELATRAFVLWWLNPLVIAESAIHGAYDTLPAFFLLGSLYLLQRERYLMSGLALGLGTFLKEFPLFITPFILVYVVTRSPRAWRKKAQNLFFVALGFVGLTVLALLPNTFFQHDLTNVINSSYIGDTSFGGFGIWGALYFPYMGPVQTWVFDHTQMMITILTISAIALSLFVTVLYYRARSPDLTERQTLWTIILLISAAYLPASVLQPQYLLWMLPWIILLLLRYREGWVAFLVLSSVPVVLYLLGVGGPTYFLASTALFWGAPSLSWISVQMQYWYQQLPLLLEVAFLPTFVTTLYLWGQGFHRLWVRPRETV